MGFAGLHEIVGVELGVLEVLPHLGAHDIDLRFLITQHTGEDGKEERLEAFHRLKIVPGTNFFLSIPAVSFGFVRSDAPIDAKNMTGERSSRSLAERAVG